MSGGSREPLKDLIREIHRRSVWQVLGVYVVGGWIAFEVVQTLTEGLGLPEWFPPLALVLLIIGLPIVLATAFVQEGDERREDEGGLAAPASDPEAATPAPRLFTWRNALMGGAAASLLWAGLAAGWLAFGDGGLPAGLSGEAESPDASTTGAQSVAVLPFDNMSADPDNEYFSQGITEEILHALSQVRDLRVPGRTSSFAFEGANLTIAQIADTLDVSHVVEGSVRRSGGRVRITAQLIDARDDEHLWSDTYERSLEDVFAVQAEIAGSITDALEVRLVGADSVRIAAEGTARPDAHEPYLRGRYFWNQRTAQSLRQAAEHFRTAIERDSTYAEAWSGLADTYSVMAFSPPDDSLDLPSLRSRGLEAAHRAVELAPGRAMTHTSLAYAHFHNGDWGEAEREFERAIELNPGYATAQQWYGEFLSWTGRPEEGLAHLRKAVEIDPVSRIANHDLANGLLFAGRFKQALEQARTTINLDPSWSGGYARLNISLVELSRYEESLEVRLEWARLAGVDTTGLRESYSCALRYRETGEPQECEWPFERDPPLRYYTATGQKEAFLRRLEEEIESGEIGYPGIAAMHASFGTWGGMDPRDDPRYQELMERLGIDW